MDISFTLEMSGGRAVVSGGFLAARPSACTAGSEADPPHSGCPTCPPSLTLSCRRALALRDHAGQPVEKVPAPVRLP